MVRSNLVLTHWDLKKWPIFHKIQSNAFSCNKLFGVLFIKTSLKFVPRVHLTIRCNWLKEWFGADQVTDHRLNQLEQLECLRSEIPPAAPWLPIIVIHIRSKQDKVKVANLKRLPTIKIFKFCKKLYTQHTFWSCLIRCINMKWIQPEL